MPNPLYEPAVQAEKETYNAVEAEQERYNDVLKEPDGKLPQTNPAIEGNIALLPQADMENLRGRWREIQGRFVDEPRESVRQADTLVDEIIKRLSDVFAGERNRLEQAWGKSGEASTEDLRQALQHYRSFFNRLLSV